LLLLKKGQKKSHSWSGSKGSSFQVDSGQGPLLEKRSGEDDPQRKRCNFIDLSTLGAVDYGQASQAREIDSGYASHRFWYYPTLLNEADKNKSGRLLHRNGATHA
jgi:hypothetical protein